MGFVGNEQLHKLPQGQLGDIPPFAHIFYCSPRPGCQEQAIQQPPHLPLSVQVINRPKFLKELDGLFIRLCLGLEFLENQAESAA